jgi:hypothetical protein
MQTALGTPRLTGGSVTLRSPVGCSAVRVVQSVHTGVVVYERMCKPRN